MPPRRRRTGLAAKPLAGGGSEKLDKQLKLRGLGSLYDVYQRFARSSIFGGDGTDENPFFSALAEALNAAAAAESGASAAAESLAREQLALQQRAQAELERQAREDEALARRKQEFSERDIITGRNLEAAGLATGPTGAIQLAFLARGQGAPQEQVRSIFQNLPFVQALLKGEGLSGFGLAEQLGGASNRVSNSPLLQGLTEAVGSVGGTVRGGNLGVNLPRLLGITEQSFGTLSDFEKEFLGALYQSETGIPIGEALSTITKSFLPTSSLGSVGIR